MILLKSMRPRAIPHEETQPTRMDAHSRRARFLDHFSSVDDHGDVHPDARIASYIFAT